MALITSGIKFPLWQFLNQPVFRASYVPVLNPRRFWYLYQIELLERCFEKQCEPTRQDP
jgi:hypothetical protein